MHIDLSGKTAVVTASTGGIGLAIAAGLAAAGARTIINGRSEASLERGLAAIRSRIPGAKLGGGVAALVSASGAARLTGEAPDADILVNNVGIYEPKPFFDISDADWER